MALGSRWPDRIITGHKIKDHLPRHWLHVKTVICFHDDDQTEAMQQTLSGWPMEFIDQEEIPEISFSYMERVETMERYIGLKLLVTHEQEFIIRLQHGHELPSPR